MARRKGYYVDGTFVAAGSELDAQLRAEQEASGRPSRTARKHASHELQDIGERLVGLRSGALESIPLPDTLREAVVDARRITSFGAKRRQIQFIGKLMRRLDPEALTEIKAALAAAER